jgi:hypothetical protein
MNKKMICLLLSLVLTACGSNQETVPATKSINYTPIFVNFTSSVVKNAAEVGLPILTGVVGGDWAGYGFLNQGELDSAQVGTPYHVFGMSNAGKEDQAIFDVGYWLFPVMVNNEYRCMLTVGKYNGEWTAVGIGAAGLATWLQAMEKSHPLLDFKAKGLVKLYDHDSTILMINPSEQQPSFLLLPYLTDLLKYLPQYSDWVNTDPVPVLSFQEIFLIYSQAH